MLIFHELPYQTTFRLNSDRSTWSPSSSIVTIRFHDYWDQFIWDHSFETTTFKTTTFETTFIRHLFIRDHEIWDHEIWDYIHMRLFHLRLHSFETPVIWDLIHLRHQSFETIFIWDHIHLRPYIPCSLDCKPQLVKLFSSFLAACNQGRLTFFFFSLAKSLDDDQSFLGYVLSTKLSFCIIFPLFSITCTLARSVTDRIMINRRQLQWCEHHYQSCQLNAKRACTP